MVPESGSGTDATPMGLQPGMLVQEIGWDDDVDEGLRTAVMDAIDADLMVEADDAVDVVLLWWRDDDGDVVDGLVDALPDLSDEGYLWLLTPKVGRPGHVDPADIAEGALAAGLALTTNVNVSDDWQAQKVVRPKSARR